MSEERSRELGSRGEPEENLPLLDKLDQVIASLPPGDPIRRDLLELRPQVFDQEAWMARLHVPLRHCGTAMTDEEVSDLSARIDLAALRAYWAAVGRGTLAVVHALHPEFIAGIDGGD